MKKTFRKRLTMWVVRGILIWLGINVGLGVWLSIVIGSLVDYHGNLRSVKVRLQTGQRLIEVLPMTTFGLINLGPMHDVWHLGMTGFALGNQAVDMAQAVTPLLTEAIAGQTTPVTAWQTALAPLTSIEDQLVTVEQDLQAMGPVQLTKMIGKETAFQQVQEQIDQWRQRVTTILTTPTDWEELFGYRGKRHYVLLLQNNMELRPTGGFLGSYAEFWLDQGSIQDLQVQDIYVPDGQIKGYVIEPAPIRQYLFDGQTPGWRLRDSNWDPDFPTAASAMKWFFEEGGVAPINGMLATNLIPVQMMLRTMGPVKLTDYPEAVTAENLYQQAQYYAETGFFPGSTQKQNFLGDLADSIMRQVLTGDQAYALQLAPIIYNSLQDKELLVTTFDNSLLWQKLGWDGSLQPIACQGDEPCMADYIAINEANLGINKTNCCVQRAAQLTVTLKPEAIEHDLKVTYTNHNQGTPNPPNTWGGGYKDYWRIIVPKTATAVTASIDGKEVTTIDRELRDDKLLIGFLVLTQGGQTSNVRVHYVIPGSENWGTYMHYQLIWQKQSGIESFPWHTSVQGEDGITVTPTTGTARLPQALTGDVVFAYTLSQP